MNTPPALDKGGAWMVIVVTDSKGRIRAYAQPGRDQDAAFQAVENTQSAQGGLWLVHWEKGFQSAADAEKRAAEITGELQSTPSPAASRVN